MTPHLLITNLITIFEILVLATFNVVVAMFMVSILTDFIIALYYRLRDVNKERDSIKDYLGQHHP